MQKKIIALAIAGLVSGGAFAQSNVTISGQFRVSFDSVSAGNATAPAASLTSRTRVVDENSNIRFAGSESLGNGLTAWFQIESALGTTDNVGTTGAQGAGASATTLGTRNTAVGLKGNFGNLWLGKWDTHYTSHAGVDANGLAAHSTSLTSNALSIIHTNNGGNGAGGRPNNVIMYSSPAMGGFGVNLGYSTSMAGNESTSAGVDKESNVWINPSYTNGPIHAFYSYLRRNDVGNLAVGTSPDAKFNRAGAAYTFPMGLKAGLIWDRNEATTAAGVTTKRTAWALPLSYATGPHTVYFTYAKANNSNNSVTGDTANTGAKMTTLGYAYAMSKRTSLAVSWWSINNEAAATYDGWHPSSNVAGSSAAGSLALAGAAGADPRKFALQVNHSF